MWVDHPTRGSHPFQNLSQHAPDCAPNCFSHQASFGFHYRNLQITPSLSITLQRHQKTQGVFLTTRIFPLHQRSVKNKLRPASEGHRRALRP